MSSHNGVDDDREHLNSCKFVIPMNISMYSLVSEVLRGKLKKGILAGCSPGHLVVSDTVLLRHVGGNIL